MTDFEPCAVTPREPIKIGKALCSATRPDTASARLNGIAVNAGLRAKALIAGWFLLTIAVTSLPISAAETAAKHPPQSQAEDLLSFSISEGNIHNEFFRKGPVAAHMLLTSGHKPRLIVAFPAGNSGVGLWFDETATPIQWQAVDGIHAVTEKDANDNWLHGVQADLTVAAAELSVRQAVLSSVRLLRGYLHGDKVPDAVTSEVTIQGKTVTWMRDRLDGNSGYKLVIEGLNGTVSSTSSSASQSASKENAASIKFIAADKQQPMKLRITALSGDTPLTPIEQKDLLTDVASDDLLSQQILAFLSYKEAMLAGSWRFLTYFGRDTLISVRLLMPALSTTTIEAALASVVNRLKSNGEVAHEEDIGEFALLRHSAETGTVSDQPIFDYKMVDDNYMLAPVIANYLLDTPKGRERATQFLQQRTTSGKTVGEALVTNLKFVLQSAEAFGKNPVADNMIKLHEGHMVGEWRDSNEGLGDGRIAFNVNAVLVPAALHAVTRLADSGLLKPYQQKADFSMATTLAAVWSKKAGEFFTVTVAKKEAQKAVASYAQSLGLPSKEAVTSIADAVSFNALSLDSQGKPIPIINSDDGFLLLFTDPDAEALEASLAALMRPFPAGLITPVGMVVANAVYGSEQQRENFSKDHYHGTVVWSWQQALFAAGIARQLQRTDLPPATHQKLLLAQERLWQVIDQAKLLKTSELWSWSYSDQEGYKIEPFGSAGGHNAESNAAQLWSTIYLAVKPFKKH